MSRRALFVWLLLLVAALTVGCGGDDTTDLPAVVATSSGVADATGDVTAGSTAGTVSLPTTEPATSAPALSTYVVEPGDTLGVIAERFGTSADELVAMNELADAAFIQVGQELIVPAAEQHAATSGDGGSTDGSVTGRAGASAPPDELASASPAGPGVPIPGMHARDVTEAMATRFGMACQGPAGGRVTWTCSPTSDSSAFLVILRGDSSSSIHSVEAAAPQVSERVAAGFLGYVASLMYDDARSIEVREWVEANIVGGGALTLGGAHFVLGDTLNGQYLTIVAATN